MQQLSISNVTFEVMARPTRACDEFLEFRCIAVISSYSGQTDANASRSGNAQAGHKTQYSPGVQVIPTCRKGGEVNPATAG